MGTEGIMADKTDDEIIISEAVTRAKLAEEEANQKDTITFPMDRELSPPRPVRVMSPRRPTLPPVSPRGAPPVFQFPQDIRIGAGGVTKPKNYEQRPMGNDYYMMPPAPPTREQQELLEVQSVLHAQGSQIEVLRGTIEGIGDNVSGVSSNVSLMNGAFKTIMAENINAVRAVSDRVSRVEAGMAGLYDQMTVLRRRKRPGAASYFTPTRVCLRRRVRSGGLPYNTSWDTKTSRSFPYTDGHVTFTPEFRFPPLTI